MEGKRKPGIYLVTDTGAEIELILADADRQETLLSKRTPAEDLVAFVNRDFSEYQRKVNALWETHPLFEPHNDVLLSEYLDFIAKALPLTEMIRELDPAAYLDVTLQAAQAQSMEDNGDPLFLSRKGAAIEQALSTPFRIQNRLRNLFEIVFAYSEQDTQKERFQTLEQTWPGIIDRDYAVRFIPLWERNGNIILTDYMSYTSLNSPYTFSRAKNELPAARTAGDILFPGPLRRHDIATER